MKEFEIFEYLKIVIPTAISLVAAIFSILTYRRNRRFENENYIFKTKQENYSKILLELGNTIDNLQKYIGEATHFTKTSNELIEEELDKTIDEINAIADKADDLVYNFENIVIANSLVIPKNVLEKLDEICKLLLNTDIPDIDDSNANTLVTKLDSELTEVINKANEINDLMRSDLNVEDLNFLLYKRLKR